MKIGNKTKDNEPINAISVDGEIKNPGLTKREYFAALALQGLLANESIDSENRNYCAVIAVGMADELIKMLNAR